MTRFDSDDTSTSRWLRFSWFYPLATAIVLGDVGAIHFQDWDSDRLLEIAVLFDLAVVLPLLYLWCYRARSKATLLPALALGSLGIWAAGYLIPDEQQNVLDSIGWLRTAAMAVLVIVEIRILTHFYGAIFSSDKTPDEIANKVAEDANLPHWLTRLLALEARLLRHLSESVRNFFRRR